MNKIIIAVILAIVGFGAIGAVVLTNSRSDTSNKTVTSHTTSNEQSSTNSDAPSTQNNTPLSGDVEIEIFDFAFKSSDVTIKKGTKVTWTNKDSAKHDVTPDNGDSNAFKGSNKLLAKNESYSFTFDIVGTYTYNCSPHPYMKGTITVIE